MIAAVVILTMTSACFPFSDWLDEDYEDFSRAEFSRAESSREESNYWMTSHEESSSSASSRVYSSSVYSSQVESSRETSSWSNAPVSILSVSTAYKTQVAYEYNNKRMIAGYSIPRIKGNSAEISSLNDKIYTELNAIITKCVVNPNSIASEGISYKWANSKGVLSLVICDRGPISSNPNERFFVYNISASTESSISDQELCAAIGVSDSVYSSWVKKTLEGYFVEVSGERSQYSSNYKQYDDQYNKTVSDSNIKSCKPYINKKGQLCVIGTVYPMAGSGRCLVDLNTQNYN